MAALAWVIGRGPAGLGYLACTTCCSCPACRSASCCSAEAMPRAGWRCADRLRAQRPRAVASGGPRPHRARRGFRRRGPTDSRDSRPLLTDGRVLVHLPAWHRSDTVALLCSLLVVPLLARRAVLADRRSGRGGQAALSRLLHRRLPVARRPLGGAGQSGPADPQPVSGTTRAELLLGLLRAAGDDRAAGAAPSMRSAAASC